jgi:hypothetical protein
MATLLRILIADLFTFSYSPLYHLLQYPRTGVGQHERGLAPHDQLRERHRQ